MEKVKEFIKKHYVVFIPVSLIVIMILTFGIYQLHRLYTNYTYDTEANLYQYFAGNKVDFVANIKLNRRDEIVDVKARDIVLDLSNKPIYYDSNDINKVIFPVNMTIINPKNNYSQEMTIKNATITYDSANTKYTLKTTNYEKEVSDLILYDGKDLYFFLEATTLTIDGEEINLGPMSYVIVNPGNTIEYYNRETDEIIIKNITNEKVYVTSDIYRVNLSEDKVIKFDSFVLLMNPDYLNEIV